MVDIAKSSRLVSRAMGIAAAAVLAVVFTVGIWGCGGKLPGPFRGQDKPAPKALVTVPPVPKKSAPYIHTVKYSGESLSIISQWYTGQMNNWEAIAKANPGMNPKQINIDDQVAIPRELIKTDKPMPFSFVQEFLPKPKPAPKKRADSQSAPPQKKDAASPRTDTVAPPETKAPAPKSAPASKAPPVIFGPKDY